MSHLSPERLAALIDEQPTAAEMAHLAACRACSRERGAYEALAAMSRTGPSIGQPLTSWDRLSPALRKQGVIETDIAAARRARLTRLAMRSAAAIALIACGTALGRWTAPAATPAELATLEAEPRFASVEEAQRAAAQSRSIYQASMAYLAGQDTVSLSVSTPSLIKARLAALERVSEAAGAALEDSPYDPVVNNIYLNAQGQRQASMRMLNTASTRLTTY